MRKRSIFVAAGMAAATIIGAMSPAAPAAAGVEQDVDVDIRIISPDPIGTLEGLTLELWDISSTPVLVPGSPCGSDPTLTGFAAPGGFSAYAGGDCDIPSNGTYAIGLDGVPEGMTVTGSCFVDDSQIDEALDGDQFQFEIDDPFQLVECDLDLIQPMLLVDKVVASGTADTSDFTIEVYGEGGVSVATGQDLSTDQCNDFGELENCLVVPLPAGTYQLGESGPDGYVASNVGCRGLQEFLLAESFPTGIGEFTISDDPTTEIESVALCEITNDYYEGSLVVTKSVTNDDGGLLGPDDFVAEIFTEPEGAPVTSATCMADGTCLDVTLPIGDYRIGEADPQGYTPSVTCTVTVEPDGPGDITTTPPDMVEPRQNEAIPGDDAVATVEPFGEVTCEIVNDDPTTTTTMAPTTTDQDGGANVPTTVAPILPPTGDDNGTMAIIATLLIAIGGALLVARRRIA